MTALFYLVPRSSSFTPVLIAISLSSETVAELDIKMTALFFLSGAAFFFFHARLDCHGPLVAELSPSLTVG
jgi:hypothetical protein